MTVKARKRPSRSKTGRVVLGFAISTECQESLVGVADFIHGPGGRLGEVAPLAGKKLEVFVDAGNWTLETLS